MSLVQLDPAFKAIHGRIGDVVYKTYRNGKVIVTRVPCFDGYVPTRAQRARRNRMKEATAYAKRIYADPVAKAVYVAAAQTLRRRPFRLAISDYLNGRLRVPDCSPNKATPAAAASPAPRLHLSYATGDATLSSRISSPRPPPPAEHHAKVATYAKPILRFSPLRPSRPWREALSREDSRQSDLPHRRRLNEQRPTPSVLRQRSATRDAG